MHRFASGVLLLVLLVTVARPGFAASIPTPVALEAVGGEGVIELHWQYGQYGQYPELDYFRVYRSIDGGISFCLYAAVDWTTPGADPRFTDTAPPASGATVYYVKAVDTTGSETERSNTAAAYPTSGGVQSPTCDGSGGGSSPQPPGAPVLSGQASGGQVSLNWTSPSSGGPVSGYRVYRDGMEIAQTAGTTYSGTYSVDGITHFWHVIAYNDAGSSPESNRVYSSDPGGDPDPELPGAPTLSGQVAGDTFSLSWTVPDTGGVPSSYVIYRDGVLLAETSSTTYSEAWTGGTHSFVVRARNEAGEGPASNTVTLQDDAGGDPGDGGSQPDPPADLAASPGVERITLSWSTPDGLYDGFRVYRGGQLIAEVQGYIWTDTSVTPDVPYSYTVTRLYNGAESSPAGPVTAAALYAPPGPVALVGQAVNGHVSLQWVPPVSGGPITGYRVYRNGELIAETTETAWSGLYQDGYSYTWTVLAYGPGGEGAAGQGVISLVHPVVGYLDDPLPLPPPPAVPMGPGYTPPPMPDLQPVMPRLGQRTGRTLPPVPQLQVPPDIPPPPALPPVEDPSESPWGLPIGQPGSGTTPLQPQQWTPPQPAGDPEPALAPSGPATPDTVVTPDPAMSPSSLIAPASPLSPSVGLSADSPLTPELPLNPDPP